MQKRDRNRVKIADYMRSKFLNSKSPKNKLTEKDNLSMHPLQSRDQYTDTEDLSSYVNEQEIDGIESIENLSVTCSECTNLVSRIDELERKLVDKDDLVAKQFNRMSEMETCLNKNVSSKISSLKISSLNTELQKMKAQITEAERKLRNETLNKNLALKRVADLEIKEGESCNQLKDKESEISTLKTQVEMQAKLHSQQQKLRTMQRNNWNRTYQNSCKRVEFLLADNRKLSAEKYHLEMKYRSVCAESDQIGNELRKEANKLKNQLAEEKKKTEDLVASDKLNSLCEILLSQKDAVIAEYLSVLDSKY